MVKRPSILLISPDNSTIICGDKFGDAYSLPMFPDPNYKPTPKVDQAPEKRFLPEATDKTVHTAANLKILEDQRKQRAAGTAVPKDEMLFEHQLLLGHVSLLTDLKWATVAVDGPDGPLTRNYLLSSDRDEHIRVSRAPPQTHVIENYCLGHGSFVSRMALVRDNQILISGGGDESLFIWDWRNGTLLNKINLSKELESRMNGEVSISVSGLWTFPSGPTPEVCMNAAPYVISSATIY